MTEESEPNVHQPDVPEMHSAADPSVWNLHIEYTHYWVLLPGFEVDQFAAAIEDMRHIVRRSEIEIGNSYGRPGTLPVLEPDGVILNGINWDCACGLGRQKRDHLSVCYEGSRDQSWEVFEFKATDVGFQFCTTRRKTYDSVVAACLLAAKHNLGKFFSIGSNGQWDEEWASGAQTGNASPRQLYERLFPNRASLRNQLKINDRVLEAGLILSGYSSHFAQRLAAQLQTT